MRGLITAIGWVLVSMAMVGCGDDAVDASGSFSCTTGLYDEDYWRLSVSGPTTVTITVDTVSPRTTFDPAFTVYGVDTWSSDPEMIVVGSYIGDGDDEFDCTFPPPAFSCPELTTDVSEDVLILVESLGSCDGNIGQYDITATGGTLEFLGKVSGP